MLLKNAAFLLFYGALASSVIGGSWAMNINFRRNDIVGRAPRGASLTSPRRGSRYSLSLADDESDPNSLGNVLDIRYTTTILLNGKEILVALDTGSTDLWVAPPDGIGSFNDTGIPLAMKYGDGSYGVSGTIGLASFEFGPYKVENQAFLNVVKDTLPGLTSLGIYGLLGLGFHVNTASPLSAAVQQKYGPEATWGHSALQNIFDQHPEQPNFIAIDLARTDDLEDTSGGSFGIGEYDDDYTSVVGAPKLPQFPKGGDRWTVLLEGIKVDGLNVPLKSTIKGVPSGSTLTLLDTGGPLSLVPTLLVNAIYAKVPGAVPYTNNDGHRSWVVPCNTTTSVSFIFGGQEFYIHPLDLSFIETVASKTDEYTVCISAFTGADDWAPGEFDLLLGDNFLRNVYSVYDFGDGETGEPYIQLLAQTDPKKAAAQVPVIRAKTMSVLPPETDTSSARDLLNVKAGSASDASGSKTTIRSLGPTSTGDSESATGGDTAQTVGAGGYGVAVIALLAANLIVTLVIAVFLILNYVRRGSANSPSWASKNGPYVPVRGYDDLAGSNKFQQETLRYQTKP